MRLTFDFPADSHRPIFVSSHGFDGEGQGGVLDEFVDDIARFFLNFFNTTYSKMFLLCYEDLYIQMVAQHVLLQLQALHLAYL
jgi:hypothetical protein